MKSSVWRAGNIPHFSFFFPTLRSFLVVLYVKGQIPGLQLTVSCRFRNSSRIKISAFPSQTVVPLYVVPPSSLKTSVGEAFSFWGRNAANCSVYRRIRYHFKCFHFGLRLDRKCCEFHQTISRGLYGNSPVGIELSTVEFIHLTCLNHLTVFWNAINFVCTSHGSDW